MLERPQNLSTRLPKMDTKQEYMLTKTTKSKNKFDFVNWRKLLINKEKVLYKINEVKNAFDFVNSPKLLKINIFT